MITISKVKSKMYKPKHDEYIFTLLTKKKHGERAVLLTVYKPTPEVADLYKHFNVEVTVHKSPDKFPYFPFYVKAYKITEKDDE
jgi:hypothetical protein